MSNVWPRDKIRELIALAQASGQSRAHLSSAKDAENFRFAIYSFRRKNELGEAITITIEDTDVIVTRVDLPQVDIVPLQGLEESL